MPIPSIEALVAECYRNDVVAVSAIDRINELRDVILNQSPAVPHGGGSCAYCGRPGAVGASCVSCGAYVVTPKTPKVAPVVRPDEPDRDCDDWRTAFALRDRGDLPDALVQVLMVVGVVIVILGVFKLVGMAP